jgi:hypothetical protein
MSGAFPLKWPVQQDHWTETITKRDRKWTSFLALIVSVLPSIGHVVSSRLSALSPAVWVSKPVNTPTRKTHTYLSFFSWLCQRPGFDSRHYQISRKVVGLERDPLSLVSTTEELLERKVAAPVYKTENTAVGIRHADHVAPSVRKSWQ